MGKLNKHTCYVAGPMERVNDNGLGWRKEITPWLQNLGIGVFCPINKPTGTPEDEENKNKFLDLKDSKDGDALSDYVSKEIVRPDLHLVDLSNFIILYIDTSVHMCGSYVEMTYAALEKKPIIVCCEQGKWDIPGFPWGLGMDHNLFFSSWDEVKDCILKIDSGEIVNNKFRLIDYGKVFGNE